MNSLRRKFLGMLGAAPVALPHAARAAVGSEMGALAVAEAAVGGASDGLEPMFRETCAKAWERLGIPQWLWEERRVGYEEYIHDYRQKLAAERGAVDMEISGLRSLSPSAKVRMQIKKNRQRIAEAERMRGSIWPRRNRKDIEQDKWEPGPDTLPV